MVAFGNRISFGMTVSPTNSGPRVTDIPRFTQADITTLREWANLHDYEDGERFLVTLADRLQQWLDQQVEETAALDVYRSAIIAQYPFASRAIPVASDLDPGEG